jgi:hypothetical protein
LRSAFDQVNEGIPLLALTGKQEYTTVMMADFGSVRNEAS